MAAGYVYILINNSMSGLIKIGKTIRDSRERARELSTTGVPTPFQVAFEVFSEEYEKLENEIHKELANFRVSSNREFFKYPLDQAIKLLQHLNSPPSRGESIYAAEDIFDRLHEKYPTYLKPDIVAVRIVQPKECVWLEITTEDSVQGYLKDQTIKRTDLGFISGGPEEQFFDPKNSVSVNAEKFVNEFDAYSIIMTVDLFHEEAGREVAREYEMQQEGYNNSWRTVSHRRGRERH